MKRPNPLTKKQKTVRIIGGFIALMLVTNINTSLQGSVANSVDGKVILDAAVFLGIIVGFAVVGNAIIAPMKHEK